ncbi:MAG: long-chain acyl-CoA synthetase [Hyphomicrobiales bacterium]|jgi:long-chain acyl-CoA synthetase|nr:long-chain acyl-CoA synthetase [Hyphomicrobiales bacterium]
MVAKVIWAGGERDGAAIAERAARGISALAALGVGEGDVVAIMLRNEVAFLEAMLIARQAGCYSCPINWHYKADEAGYILRDCSAKALIVHADLLRQIEGGVPAGCVVIVVEPPPELRAAFRLTGEQCAVPPGATEWESWLAGHELYAGPPRQVHGSVPYSSGTTGKPKGVLRRPPPPEQMARMLEITQTVLGIKPGMRTAMVAPLYHSAPASYGSQSLLNGEIVVMHERFAAERLLADIEKHRLDRLYLVPTHFVRLLRLPEDVKRRYDFSSIDFVASTGSPCPPEVKKQMIDWWGPVINESYASSEAGFITLMTSQESRTHPGSAGRPVAGAEVRIMNDAGEVLPPYEPGLIYCRQAAYPDFTYINRPEDRKAIDRDGLVAVGDVGYFDREGYLYICDRKSDMVISGGVNIYPAEIEAVLITMPEVADCAVFGIPDAEFGEALAAHVQPHNGAAIERDAVRTFLKERIADYKVPRVIEFSDALPREESGKIFKRRLRDPYWEGVGRRI